MIYYTADTHFRDQAIMRKCQRPFKTLQEMEKKLINNWNCKINDDDDVYVLGDVVNENDQEAIEVIRSLKGHKHLIVGNHDHVLLDKLKNDGVFESIKFIELILDNNRKVCVCHYPLMDWIARDENSVLIYGHIHNKTRNNGIIYKKMKDFYAGVPAYNCGVDVCGFEPRTLDELIILKEANRNEPYIN